MTAAAAIFRYLLRYGDAPTRALVLDILRVQHARRFPSQCRSR